MDLKQIQRRTSLSFFEDGLWDLLLGIFLLGWGAGILSDTAAFAGIWIVVLYPIVFGLKKRLTYPRIGYVKICHADRRLRQLLIAGVVTLVAGILSFFMFESGSTPGWVRDNFDFIFGGVFAVLTLTIAAWWWVRRWYFYGVLILSVFAAQNWLGWPFEWAFFGSGGFITVVGALVLTRFLRRHPRVTGEDGLDAG